MATAIFADYDNDGLVDIYVSNNCQQVEDGKGKGFSAEVDSANRLLTKSTAESDFDDAIANIEDLPED